MKIGIKEITPKFKPFIIEFKIESLQDMYNLWHRFNLPMYIVNAQATDTHPKATDDYGYAWGIINAKLKECLGK